MKKSKNNLFSTIKFKLAGSYCMLIAFIIIVGVSAYTSASNAIKENYKTATLQALNMLGEYLEFGFNAVSGAAVEYLVDESITEYLNGGLASRQAEQTKYYNNKKSEITTKVTADTFLKNIYFFSDPVSSLSTNKKSTLNMFSDYIQSEQGKVLAEDTQAYYWFGQPSAIDNTLNVNIEDYAIRMVKAFYRQNAFLAMDIDKQAILDILNKMQAGTDSRIAFVTLDGRELQQDGSFETFFYQTEFYERAWQSEAEVGTIENLETETGKHLFLFRKISNTGAMVCVLIPNEEITGQVAGIKYLTLVLIIAAVVIALAIGGGISISISRAIKYFVDKMECIAGGNIGIRLHTRRRDEFGTLAGHMNHMLESMHRLIGGVKAVGREVSDSAQRVVNSSEIISESTAYISASMNQIEIGLSMQAKDTVDGVDKLESLADRIGLVNKETMEMKEITDKTTEAIKDSINRMQILGEKTEQTSGITKAVISSIEELKVKSGYIEDIIDTIDNISEETTLLSLNAAIEAARAGSAGRGFAIVADSIKKLAEQSLESANRIRNIVSEIGEETIKTASAAKDAGKVITYQEAAVVDMKAAFDGMKEQVHMLENKMGSIVSSIAQMQTEKDESVTKIESISSVTEEAASASASVSEKTQKQVQIVDELSNLSEKMLVQVEQLEITLQKFATNEERTVKGGKTEDGN